MRESVCLCEADGDGGLILCFFVSSDKDGIRCNVGTNEAREIFFLHLSLSLSLSVCLSVQRRKSETMSCHDGTPLTRSLFSVMLIDPQRCRV